MKIMKIFLYSILVAFIGLVGCSSSTSNETNGNEANEQEEGSKETIKLKLGTYFANTSNIWTDYSEPWMERVTELTDGQVQFETYPGEQLGKAHDMLQLTKDGVMDIGVFPTNYFPDNMPLGNMLAGMPNLSENVGQGTLALNELLNENSSFLEVDYLRNGVMPISPFVSPTYELWTKDKEIRVPADLKGLKVRTPGGVSNEVYEYLGVVPVSISHSEVYEAIEKGVIDVYAAYSQATISNATHEILNQAVYPHIGTAIHAFHVNEKVWNSLPEDVQKAMLQAGEEISNQLGDVYEKAEVEFQENFKAKGGTIVELTQEEQQQWKTATEEFTQMWLEKHQSDGHPYEEVLNQYKELLEKHKDQ